MIKSQQHLKASELESKHKNQNGVNQKPGAIEDAEKLISKKRAEKADEGMRAVRESAQGVQSEVADLMAGVEAPKEGVSEKKGESGEKGDLKTQSTGASDDSVAADIPMGNVRPLPTEEIMIRKIRTAINAQIALEIKKAKHLEKHLATGSAQEYNVTIARIRRLKETLQSLLTGTFEYIKNMYQKYFRPDGHRKNLEEL